MWTHVGLRRYASRRAQRPRPTVLGPNGGMGIILVAHCGNAEARTCVASKEMATYLLLFPCVDSSRGLARRRAMFAQHGTVHFDGVQRSKRNQSSFSSINRRKSAPSLSSGPDTRRSEDSRGSHRTPPPGGEVVTSTSSRRSGDHRGDPTRYRDTPPRHPS